MQKISPNYTYLKKNVPEKRVTLLQGGTRSGKTYAICHYIIWLCHQYEGMTIDIVRDTFTALKATAWNDFKDILLELELYNSDNHNKTDHIYNLNNNTISYYGADNPQKIHGRKRQILWINEAHQFPSETIDQLFPRTEYRIIADYNPALPTDHWLDSYIEKYPPLITTYRDNPYLTADQIADIESRKNNPTWWKVYGNGERTSPEGQIFTNYKNGKFDNTLTSIYGLDFGFSIDPTALTQVSVDKRQKKIYIKELAYAKNLSSEAIDKILKENTRLNGLIIADSADPRMIDYLKKRGHNIRGAEKGQDSVRAGIMQMLDYELIIEGENLAKELNNYVWNDKKAGVPIDSYNHALDGARYALSFLLKPRARSSNVAFVVNN